MLLANKKKKTRRNHLNNKRRKVTKPIKKEPKDKIRVKHLIKNKMKKPKKPNKPKSRKNKTKPTIFNNHFHHDLSKEESIS